MTDRAATQGDERGLDRFVREVVVAHEPRLLAGERDALEELRRRAIDAGVWGHAFPPRHDAEAIDARRVARAAQIEGLSPWGGVASGTVALPDVRWFMSHGSPELARRFLEPLRAGAIRASFAMTERDSAGSDPGAIATSATRDGGGWRIDGAKWCISTVREAACCTVVARTGPAPTALGLFVVDLAASGVAITGNLPVLGEDLGQTAVRFDGVRVDDAFVLGDPAHALDLIGRRLALARCLRAGHWVGHARRALELLRERAAGRIVRGTPLAERQLVQAAGAEAWTAVAAAAALVDRAAAAIDAGEDARAPVAAAKLSAARALERAVDAAVQVHGAAGLTEQPLLAHLLRIGRAARILDGADELQLLTIARSLWRAGADPIGPLTGPPRSA